MKKRLRLIVTLLFILMILGGLGYAYYYLTTTYRIANVYVEGSSHYTDAEIIDFVMEGKFGTNSLYLSYKYKNKAIDDLPFVETMDVTVISPDSVKITVYEKALAGYIEYLGRYVYFDKDGYVVEVSEKKTVGIPEVIGIDFDYVVLYEQLPAKDMSLFKSVLNITQLMTKYGVEAQKMYFKDSGEIVLYKDDIVINLGQEENLDIKIMNLPPMLEKLEGRSGTLKMENYDETTKKVTFKPDDEETDSEE